jgi:branched-subunit amino acid transport protein
MTVEAQYKIYFRRIRFYTSSRIFSALLFASLFITLVYSGLDTNNKIILKNLVTSLIKNPFQYKSFLILVISSVVIFALIQIALIYSDNIKYKTNSSRYFTDGNTFHHRKIASRYLGRKLVYGEEVHHINGKTTDNNPQNLCILTHDNHIAFHVWLKDQYIKNGYKYPPIKLQRNILRTKFKGILL